MVFGNKELNCDDYRRIYKMLDSVSPIDGDCGKLCSAACCRDDGNYPEYIRNENYYLQAEAEGIDDGPLGMYLLPGEESVHDAEDDWLSWSEDDAAECGFPASWSGKVFFVKCKGPSLCRRSLRPIQCRTFPSAPYLSREGKLCLILHTDVLPYRCPLVCGAFRLNSDFLESTYRAWKLLVEDKRILDLVEEDSRFRDSCCDVRIIYECMEEK